MLSQRCDRLLVAARLDQQVLAAAVEELPHQLRRDASEWREQSRRADGSRRHHVLRAGNECKASPLALGVGEQLDHELPVETEIDDAGKVRQPVDELEAEVR